MSTAIRWQRLQDLFHAACELPTEAREGFARRAACDDSLLMEDLLRMLDIENEATHRMGKPAASVLELLGSNKMLPPGTRFGPWAIDELLGHGGMGAVYLAHRADGAYQRQVALKLIDSFGLDNQQRAFFEVERQMLAQMRHPVIALIHDAGADASERLWLVMEYIEGEPISRYCQKRALPLRERLMLFLRVCDGVQHAHQKGVVHRDIKPANVLVEEVDGIARPRIIDFGIAAGIGGTAQPAGTPGYMSPEQRDPNGRCDSRCDVYALGALLYELVAGERPPAEDAGPDARTPSRRLAELPGDTLQARAQQCGTTPTDLLKMLRNDLDWVVRKAMEDDPEQRYASVALLAEDLHRYLDGYPVNAAPPRRGQAALKFIRRHRPATAAAAIALLALLGGLVATIWALGQAEREATRARVTSDFLGTVLSSVDPDFARDLDPTLMLRVLDDAARRASRELATDPDGRLAVELVIAESYTALGQPRKAIPQLQNAREQTRERLGADSREALLVAQRLGTALVDAGQYAESESVLREAIDIASRHPDRAGPTLEADLRSRLSWTLRQRSQLDEATQEARRAFDEIKARVPENHPQLLDAGQRLAILMSDAGKYGEAIALLQEMISLRAEDLGFDHPRVLTMRLSLSVFHLQQRDYAGAEAILKAMLGPVASQFGDDSPTLAMVWGNLGGALRQQGGAAKIAEAGPYYRLAYEHSLQRNGPEAPMTLMLRGNHANWLLDNGQAQAARDEQVVVLALAEKVLGPESKSTAEFLRGLGLSQIALGDLVAARASLERSLAIHVTLFGDAEGPLARIRESIAKLEAAEAAAP